MTRMPRITYGEEEEAKDDGSIHATAVADLVETTKPQGEREALESEGRKFNQANQAKTKAKARATTGTSRRRE